MPSESPLRPTLLKGALAVFPTHTPGAQPSAVILFQFNPDTMKRTIAHRAATPPNQGNTGAAKEDIMRVSGPPVETVNLTIDLDATDHLAEPDQNAPVAEHGLHPALATLELLMYPTTDEVQKQDQQAEQGQVQVAAADLPLVLFIWGKSRVAPVKITSFSVTEEAFDTRLNPIAAKVELGLQVLTSVEFPESSFGREAFVAYQKAKEGLAQLDRPGAQTPGLRNLLPP
jgi:hypothetical protein